MQKRISILLVYTGGTIGMVECRESGALEPVDFRHLEEHFPELKGLGYDVSAAEFTPALDSSDVGPAAWGEMVKIIEKNYEAYDGFVILHGTDTMSYTASALSFMLEGLAKPVILTGSQLPIGVLRTDAKENLVTAIEIAAAKDEDGRPLVPEVCIFFENRLMRGNRTTKVSAEGFNAFRSYNFHTLADAGVCIKYDLGGICKRENATLKVHYAMDCHVAVLKLFPGIGPEVIGGVLGIPNLKGIVMETFGSGNAPSADWFLQLIGEAVARGVVVVNISQCPRGSVDMGRYETGVRLAERGVVSGYDSTTESAVTKLMFLFGAGLPADEVKQLMSISLRGEINVN